jgi:hypothetical protein
VPFENISELVMYCRKSNKPKLRRSLLGSVQRTKKPNLIYCFPVEQAELIHQVFGMKSIEKGISPESRNCGSGIFKRCVDSRVSKYHVLIANATAPVWMNRILWEEEDVVFS